MASLGELFVELGVVGDVKPLEKAIGTMKEAVKQIDNEIKANQRLLKYLQDIKNARNDGEKATIKENFAKEIQKQKMLNEIDANQKAVDGKKEFASKIAGVVKGVGAFVGALTGAAIALNKFTNDLVESNQAMLNLTRTSDISLKTFQKWNSIGRMFGVQNAAQQIEGLNQRLFQLRLTGEGASGFQIAGINPIGQNAEGVLEQLRQRIKGLDDTSASWLLQQMGIDPQMLHILRMTREEFEALNNTIKQYQLTDEQRRSIQEMNVQLQIAGIQLKYFKDRIILALMPVWVKFVQSFERVTEGLAKFVKWVAHANTFASTLTGKILALAAALGVVRLALLAITAHPIVAGITAVLGGIYLLVDDIMAYFKGGGSMIGVLIAALDQLNSDLEDKNYGAVFESMLGPLKMLSKLSMPWASQIISAAQAIIAAKREMNNTSITGTSTGGAAPITGSITGGYAGILPDLNKNFETPGMLQSVSNNSQTYNNDNRQVSQNIQITTTQPAFDIERELRYANMAFA